MINFPVTPINKLNQAPDRAHYDTKTVYAILDASIVCHLAFIDHDKPFVIPTLYARDENQIIIHGASTSRLICCLQQNNEVCVGVSILDGLVLGRSVFEHSVNYRSVVLFCKGSAVLNNDEKKYALEKLTERVLPGRWQDARKPTAKELDVTSIVRLKILSATAKIRNSPPEDLAEDCNLPIWAGEIPICSTFGSPVPASNLRPEINLPEYLLEFYNKQNKT